METNNTKYMERKGSPIGMNKINLLVLIEYLFFFLLLFEIDFILTHVVIENYEQMSKTTSTKTEIITKTETIRIMTITTVLLGGTAETVVERFTSPKSSGRKIFSRRTVFVFKRVTLSFVPEQRRRLLRRQSLP